MNPSTTNIRDVLTFSLREYRDNGILIPITNKVDIPFNIKRLFYVRKVSSNGERGHHAHKKCSQILICLTGSINVKFWDGVDIRSEVLASPNEAILVPAGIWVSETYSDDAILLVLCDYIYDPGEYIKDKTEFERWKEKK